MVTRVLWGLLLTASLAPAQSYVKDFAKDFAHDQKRIWTAPFRMNQRQFWTLAVPLVGGTVALKSVDRRLIDAMPNSPDQIKWSGRASNLGTAYGLGLAVGLTTVYGAAADKPAAKTMGRNGLLALGDALAVTYALKVVTRRERPDAPRSRGSFWSGGDSFPSGHAMTAFAVATAVARHPRCPKWLGITLYGTAVVISLSRLSGNRHYPSDVYFGAFSGALIGNMVAGTRR
ncbi:MAG: phosphatase PAP2 family protein [Bryobacterales bacterium]|nr:phosphatase PAP2 family protein [Bryobacterales bacterium]